MIIEVLYDVGQVINFYDQSEQEDCSFCEGVGTIIGHDKTTSMCPVCFGQGKKKAQTKRGVVLSYNVNAESVKRNEANIEINYKVKSNNQTYDLTQDQIVYTGIISFES